MGNSYYKEWNKINCSCHLGTSGQHGQNQGPDIWAGLNVLQKSGKDTCGVSLKGVSANSIFWGGCSSWIHKKCSSIPDLLKSDASFRYKRCTGQAKPVDGRRMAEVTEGREKEAWGGAILLLPWGLLILVAAVNSLLSHDAVSHGTNSTGSCPSSPTAHFPSPPEEEFTILVPCSMQAKRGPQPYLTCIACNVLTELCFAGCAASPPRTKSSRGISW